MALWCCGRWAWRRRNSVKAGEDPGMIVILDYEMGNVGSIQNMLRKIGVREVTISRDAGDIRRADRLILPGVGAFDAGMERLREFGLPDLIREHALERGKPLLGICLGMQLLGQNSQEGTLPGLGLLPFSCKRFDFPPETALKIPHMGWDRTYVRIQTPLTEGLEPGITMSTPTTRLVRTRPWC